MTDPQERLSFTMKTPSPTDRPPPIVEPGTSTTVSNLPHLNRRLRRALRHGHVLRPSHADLGGFLQRVHKQEHPE